MRRTLLEAAHRHAQSGKTYLATDRYLKLMREHPGTLEGDEARQALLDIAQRYEAEGKKYHALSLYDEVAAWLAAGKSSGSKDESPVLDVIPFVDLTEDIQMAQNFEPTVAAEMVTQEPPTLPPTLIGVQEEVATAPLATGLAQPMDRILPAELDWISQEEGAHDETPPVPAVEVDLPEYMAVGEWPEPARMGRDRTRDIEVVMALTSLAGLMVGLILSHGL